MKKQHLKTMQLKKCLIANMTRLEKEAIKGGTRTNGLTDNPDNSDIEITICPGHMFCVNNMSV